MQLYFRQKETAFPAQFSWKSLMPISITYWYLIVDFTQIIL